MLASSIGATSRYDDSVFAESAYLRGEFLIDRNSRLPFGFAAARNETHVMRPIVPSALFMSLLIAGCASGGSSARVGSMASSNHRLVKYSVPIVTSHAVQSAVNRASDKRDTQNSIGNVPTIDATVALTDAPLFGVSQINLAIMGVNALQGSVATPIVAYDSDVVVDILNYQLSALALGSAQIPLQAYDGLQLVIDPTQSTVVANGQTYPLLFGSMQGRTFVPSTATVQAIDYPLAFGTSSSGVTLLVDFSAERSIRYVNGNYQVAPVLGGTAQSNAAVIAGTLVSAAGTPVQDATVVVTDANGTVIAAAPSDQNGNFHIHAIAAGTYTVTVENAFTTDAGMQVFASDGRTDTLPPLSISVPAGYEIDLGQISD